MKTITPSLALILVVLALNLVTETSCKIEERYRDMPDRCLMPMDFGYCRAKMKRYYFNFKRNQCSAFFFGGCAGNVNNFETLEECNETCAGKELLEAI